MKKPKMSRAARAAITAFRGLQADEEAHVLHELGLTRNPTAAECVSLGRLEPS